MIRYGNAKSGSRFSYLAICIIAAGSLFATYPSVSMAGDMVNVNTSGRNVKAPQRKDAVLIIRFNQKHVYFENALKKVVDKVNAIKPNAAYEIQSITHVNDDGANADKYLDNLRNIVAVFGKLGVSKDRLSVRTDVSDIVDNQEVHIFVR